MTTHTLFVCTTCGSTWEKGQRVGQSRGELLLEALQPAHSQWSWREQCPLQPVECMSACSRPCSVALAAAGKHTYLFGDLASSEADLGDVCGAILDCAALYLQQPQGLMAWSARPERLRKGLIARIPPLPSLS
ncbi:MAG: DUF1636 domain-containing protein [Synechococcaceae cyanobacterium SM2_3_1]|nr:DUF1636 domain-containing protein [Synechococcaceae cyanobacterium SM2_3_1]